MKKICFVLLALLPLLSYAQAPWNEFYEGEKDSKGRPEGKGVMGFGNKGRYVRYKGYFHKGIPGDGKHEGMLWFYQDGKPSSHEVGIHKGKKHKEFKYLLDFADGPAEQRCYNENWRKGIMKKGVIDGLCFEGKDNTIFKGTIKDWNYITGILIDFNTRKHKIYTKGTSTGWRDDLTAEGEKLYKEHYARFVFSKLNTRYVLFDELQRGEGYVYDLNLDADHIEYVHDIMWSGKIVDGKISGPGTGIVKIDDKFVYFNSDNYVNGFPSGKIAFRTLNQKYDAELGPLNDGIAYVKNDDAYGFINGEGRIIVRPQYPEIISPFQNGKASVRDKEKGEIIIDRNGNFVDLTENQRNMNAENARKEEEKRIAAQQEEERRRIAAEEDFQNKQNSVGKMISWRETYSYDTASFSVLGLLASATGLTKETYIIEYIAVVESVLGDETVKCVIKDARILDSKGILQRASGKVSEQANQSIGQTRVLKFSEFTLR